MLVMTGKMGKHFLRASSSDVKKTAAHWRHWLLFKYKSPVW